MHKVLIPTSLKSHLVGSPCSAGSASKIQLKLLHSRLDLLMVMSSPSDLLDYSKKYGILVQTSRREIL